MIMRIMYKNSLLWMFTMLIIVATSCSDDSQVISEQTLKVLTSDLDFTADGGTGTITLSSESRITSATSSDSWCAVSLTDANTVTVKVSSYSELPSRVATITIKDAVGSEVHVAATQTGFVLSVDGDRIVVGDDEGSTSVSITHTSPVTLESSADWLTASISGKTITVNCTENSTGNVRSAYIYAISGSAKDSVLVVQGERDDLLGEYYYAGYNTSTSSLQYINAVITADGDGIAVTFPDFDWTLPVTYDADNLSFRVTGGAYMGTYDLSSVTYYVYFCPWDTEIGSYTWGTSYSCDYVCYGTSAGSTLAQIEDNGSWSGKTISGAIFSLFKKQQATSANRYGILLRMISSFFLKKDASTGAPKATLVSAKDLSIK